MRLIRSNRPVIGVANAVSELEHSLARWENVAQFRAFPCDRGAAVERLIALGFQFRDNALVFLPLSCIRFASAV